MGVCKPTRIITIDLFNFGNVLSLYYVDIIFKELYIMKSHKWAGLCFRIACLMQINVFFKLKDEVPSYRQELNAKSFHISFMCRTVLFASCQSDSKVRSYFN